MKVKLSILLIITAIINIYAQQLPYGIKNPGYNYNTKCQRCTQSLNSLPPEVTFGINMDSNYNLYFVISHADFFRHLFKSGSDGIVVDIVTKDQYGCSTHIDFSKSPFRGTTLEPVYYKYMKKNVMITPEGFGAVLVGKLPEELQGEEIEFNIVMLEKKNYCHYRKIYNIQSYRWDLLEMGLFMDSLTYRSDLDSTTNSTEGLIINSKELHFEIPFEKDKSEYNSADIKPLYDSLKLSSFNIMSIKIHAYASVEGSFEHNIKLQEKRANTIVEALQSFQEPSIKTEVSASENWVEFLQDIKGGKYQSYGKLSKKEVKKKLEDQTVIADLEPILGKHRKALVTIELQKKSSYTNISDKEIMQLFRGKVKDNELEEANKIQNEIMNRVIGQKSPEDLLDSLEVPNKVEYGALLRNKYAFQYFIDNISMMQAYEQFKKLDQITKNNPQVKYNLYALKFRMWISGKENVDPELFLREIKKLKTQGIDNRLVKRMMINYHIIMCSYHMANANFREKDRSLKYMYRNYALVPLKPFDYLSLAQYFTSYAKYDWATSVIKPKLKKLDVNEDLLFYYLNLTLSYDKEIAKPDYKMIMMNAINKNKTRFCELFNSSYIGGVSFQLLENETLKNVYCDNCD